MEDLVEMVKYSEFKKRHPDAETGGEISEDAFVVVDPGWWAGDGAGADLYFPDAKDEGESADAYVDGGDWGRRMETQWESVKVWRTASVSQGGFVVEIIFDQREARVEIPPVEPECLDGGVHDWEEGREYAHGGGVFWVDVCKVCGLSRTTDTWSQDPETGQQGLRSVSYER